MVSIIILILFTGAIVAFAYVQKIGPFKPIIAENLPITLQEVATTTSVDSTSSSTSELAVSTIVSIPTSTTTDVSTVKVATLNQTDQAINLSELLVGGSASAKINPNSKIGYSIIVSPGSNLLFMAGWDNDELSLTLTDPQGKIINMTSGKPVDPSSKAPVGKINPIFLAKDGKYSLMYTLDGSVSAGIWKLLAINSSNKTTNFGVSVTGSSNIFVVPSEPDVRVSPNESLILSVDVAENTSGQPMGTTKIIPTYLNDLDVTATIYGYDYGNHAAVETVSLTNVSKMNGLVVTQGTTPLDKNAYMSGPINDLVPGDYLAVYTFRGKNSEGQNVAEQTSSSNSETYINVSSGNATIDEVKDHGIDTVTQGITGVISFDLLITYQKTGTYNLSATAVAPDGKKIPLSSGGFYGAVGTSGANLLLQLSDLGTANITNGVYKLEDVQLF
ncbi:MAG: hypothetical protein WCO18_02750, partial [bacterium]